MTRDTGPVPAAVRGVNRSLYSAFRTGAFLLALSVCLPAISAEQPEDRAAVIRDKIMPEVARLRGLDFTSPVPVRNVTQQDVADYVRKTMDEEATPAEVRGAQKILAYLGLIPAGADLRELLVGAYSQQIAGYYDDRAKAFSIVTDSAMPPEVESLTIAHELTHALQDQRFDLAALREAARDNDDFALALMALAEGDASDIMLRYATRTYPRGAGPPKDFSKLVSLSTGAASIPSLPMFLSQNILFPYSYGSRFVAELALREGDSAINAAFLDPPLSTEQIMNSDKYLARDDPFIVDMPDLTPRLPRGWQRLEQTPLGQFNLGLYLTNTVGGYGIDPLIAPWKGDTMAAYAGPNEDDFFFIYYSTWDTPEAALAFAFVYRKALEMRFGDLTVVLDRPPATNWTRGGSLYFLRRSGCDVFCVERVPREFAAAVLIGVEDSPKYPLGQVLGASGVRPGEPTPNSN